HGEVWAWSTGTSKGTTVGQPLGHEPVVFDLGLWRPPAAAIEVDAVDGDDRPIAGLVVTKRRDPILAGHARPLLDLRNPLITGFPVVVGRSVHRGQVRRSQASARGYNEWAQSDSNTRPHPYQGCALAN